MDTSFNRDSIFKEVRRSCFWIVGEIRCSLLVLCCIAALLCDLSCNSSLLGGPNVEVCPVCEGFFILPSELIDIGGSELPQTISEAMAMAISGVCDSRSGLRALLQVAGDSQLRGPSPASWQTYLRFFKRAVQFFGHWSQR